MDVNGDGLMIYQDNDLDKQLAMDKIMAKTRGLSLDWLSKFNLPALAEYLDRIERKDSI